MQSKLRIKYNRKRKKQKIEEGDEVYIRKAKSIRLANAVCVHESPVKNHKHYNLEYIYKAKLKKEGSFRCDLKDVLIL